MTAPRLTVYIETYGCQMNVSDSELMYGKLEAEGYVAVDAPQGADVVLVNTCAIRENAEQRVIGRLGELRRELKPGAVLGVAAGASVASDDPLSSFPQLTATNANPNNIAGTIFPRLTFRPLLTPLLRTIMIVSPLGFLVVFFTDFEDFHQRLQHRWPAPRLRTGLPIDDSGGTRWERYWKRYQKRHQEVNGTLKLRDVRCPKRRVSVKAWNPGLD